MEVIKNDEVTMEELEETRNDVEETEEGLLVKAKNGFKKHGKKIAAGAVIGASVLIGYMLGHKSGNDDDFEDEEDSESNIIDVEDYSEKDAE